MFNDIQPKREKIDTNGKHIQVHGGSIIEIDGIYYWYGENKEGITIFHDNGEIPYWHHGIRYYSSRDLYNWKDEGLLVPESNDPNHPLYGINIMDRPHIIYNEKNKEFILWAKCSVKVDFDNAGFAIYKGKTLKTLRYVKFIEPQKYKAGDFDLFKTDGKAFIVYSNPKHCTVLYELTDDYCDMTDKYSVHLNKPYPPYVREAPAVFKYKSKIFMLTSGTTGYFPNQTIAYDITNLHGKWIQINKPCQDDINKDSFHAQYSSVFHDQKSNTYIAIGDNWLPDFDSTCIDINQVFNGLYSKGKEKGIPISDEKYRSLSKQLVFNADYIILPIQFKNDKPVMEFLDSWKIQ